MNKVFDAYSEYYDLLYQDKDYSKEANYVSNILGDSKTILELGCGTGKHAKLLSKKGFDIFGVDLSDSMLKKANELGINCQLGDARTFRTDKIFDSVISLFHVMSYQNSDEDVLKEFLTANFHLNKGGTFIFDVWNKDAVLYQVPEKRVKKLENNFIEVKRFCTPLHLKDKNIVEVHYDIEVVDKMTNKKNNFTEVHSMRYFSSYEINDFASKSGFNIIKSEEWLTKKQPSKNTWGVCYIGEKV